MLQAILRQWFFVFLLAGLVVGFGFPGLIRPIAEITLLRSLITATVLFLMGLTLNAESVARSIRNPTAVLTAIAVSTFVVPLLALPSLWILSADMAGGLIVTTLVPCTLASAAVWTRKGGGDDAVAMVVSVVTNVACFLVAPLGLWLTLGQVTEISAREQVVSLAIWVVLPLLVGQIVRRSVLPAWAAKNQARLSSVAQCGILVMVAFGSVASADRLAQREDGAGIVGELAGVGTLAVLVHCGALVIGIAAARRLGAAPPQQIAVGIAGSQKTLMVGLQIALDCGVSVLPMIIYHVGQLVIDTFVVQHWAKRYPPPEM